ncbi:hypothetical protein [Dyadobacter sp. NIV53]|uniref:hypothetical protein n=1 Tax=Dyadobacter sp. NIV53 TaxID=2861765 RepID=UPI001C888FAD|nr:hypothetical protein [Dyadobacter sp. NIV53]
MEQFEIKKEVRLICQQAESFPDGIMDAFSKLQASLPNCADRTWYGLSKPDHGDIIYKAAVTELSDTEAEVNGFESFIVTSGTYLTKIVTDWRQDTEVIGTAFNELLKDPQLDPSSYCVEWYLPDDKLMCMVKLKTE